jgi:Flp pilus assembly protein TadD
LVKARDTGSPEKRQHAVNALLQIRQRSPAFPFVQVALQHASKKPQAEWKEAIQNYSKAIELDPEFPEAYIGRADCYIRQEKFTEAGQDYGKALELDPFSSPATTGVCIVMTIDGKYAAAIEKLEAAREKFPRDNMFAYNSACVYGRAVEHLKAHPEIADREKLLAQYTKTAIADLKRSVQLGFQDLKWMQEDPDLNSLHDEPEFQNLYKTAEKAGADDPPK